MRVVITTAVPASAQHVSKVKKAVTAKYGSNVTFETKVDPNIIGGIQIALDSRLLDGSIRNEVEQLALALHKRMMEMQTGE